jgi:hypothetical protein
VDASENKAIVQRFGEMVDGGDLGQLEVLCAPDLINHTLAPGRPNDIEGMREFLSSAGRRAHAGSWVERVVIAEGDWRRGVRRARRSLARGTVSRL